MGNTVAGILEALIDNVGSGWLADKSFVNGVAVWVECTRENEMSLDGEED